MAVRKAAVVRREGGGSEEAARMAGVSGKKLREMEAKTFEVRSVSAEGAYKKGGERRTLLDTIAAAAADAGEVEFPSTLSSPLAQALSPLTPRERYVLSRRFSLFGLSRLTHRQLAAEMGVTRERVKAVEKGAIKLLRESGGGEQLLAASLVA